MMEYFAIWTPEDQDNLEVVRFTSKEALYYWLKERGNNFDTLGFLTFYEEDLDYAMPGSPVDAGLLKDCGMLIIRGKAIEPRPKKIQVMEWWVE